MKRHLPLRSGDDVRAMWFATVAIVAIGGYLVEARYEPAIAASRSSSEAFYRRMVAADRIVAQAGALQRVQRVVLERLSHVSSETSLSAGTAALITTLNHDAAADHLRVTGIDPAARAPANRADPIGDRRLLATPVAIRISGRFADLLRFTEGLSHNRTLVGVTDVQFALAQGGARTGEPTLDATIHATLYRLHMPLLIKENRSAPNP